MIHITCPNPEAAASKDTGPAAGASKELGGNLIPVDQRHEVTIKISPRNVAGIMITAAVVSVSGTILLKELTRSVQALTRKVEKENESWEKATSEKPAAKKK
jgi:hypothetical protein